MWITVILTNGVPETRYKSSFCPFLMDIKLNWLKINFSSSDQDPTVSKTMNRSEISKFPTTDLTECCIDNYIPDDRGILLEEIQIKYRMNESSVKWIENNNIGEENPLLVLSILDDRYLQYKDRIHASLIANNAEKIGDICYQFETLGTLWKANKALRKDVIEVIYSRDPLIQSVLAAQIYLFKYWSNN